MINNVFVEQTRRFHVVNNRGTGVARQHVTREEHHLAIRKNHFTGLGDDPQTITITVEREAQFDVGRFDNMYQFFKIFQL